MRHITIRSLLVTALATTAATAQDLPPPEDLAQRVQGGLPGYWSIQSFRLIASEARGDPISPAAAIRFEADAAPVSDLFADVGERVGPFDVVVATHPAEVMRTLYGTMQLDYRAGEWSGVTRIENPVDGLGQPKDYFASPVLELGSDRQQELIEHLKGDTLARARIELDAELRALDAEGAERIDALRAERDAQIRELEAESAAAIAAREAWHRTEMAELEQRLMVEREGAEDRLAAEVERYRSELARQREEVEAGHAAALQALEERHAAATGELRARQAEEMAMLETGLEAMRMRLETQMATADDVIEAQEAVLARQQAIDANSARVAEILTRNTGDRRMALDAMIGTWRGTADCPNGAAHTVALTVNEATSNNLAVAFGDTLNRIDRPTPAELVLVPDAGDAPMTLRFATADDRFIVIKNGQELRLGADGRLGHPGNEGQCAFALLPE